jgi:hypothetical protein
MEQVAVRAPFFQGGLHRRRCYGQIKEAHRRPLRLERFGHQAGSLIRAGPYRIRGSELASKHVGSKCAGKSRVLERER